MTYKIEKQLTIRHTGDDWEYRFSSDEYGTICVYYYVMGAGTCKTPIHIPKDCIQNFIDVLEQFKDT